MVKTFSRAKDGNTQIAPNFKIAEFACNDGTDKILLDTRLPSVLQRIRELAGNKPVSIGSGYRTPEWNKKVGGATKSLHMDGKAADIQIRGVTPNDICRCAETALKEAKLQGGICRYETFAHVDTRDVKWRAVDGGAKSVSGFDPMPSNGPAPNPSPVPDYKDVSYTVAINGSGLRVRSEPSTNGDILGHVNRPEQYRIAKEAYGDGADTWGMIGEGKHKGGWISLCYTVPAGNNSTPQLVDYQVEVLVNDLRVRSGPGTKYSHIRINGKFIYAVKGHVYNIARESTGEGAPLWGQVKGNDICGAWIALDPKWIKRVTPGSSSQSGQSVTGTSNEQSTWTYLKKKGLSDFATAGIMGNIRVESNFNPAAMGDRGGYVNGKFVAGAAPNLPTSGGVAQWHDNKENSGRFTNMKKAAGPDWQSNLSGQLDFLWKEMSGGNGFTGGKATFEALKAAKTVREASNIFMCKFERPADQSEKAKANRASYGQAYFDKYKGMV